MVNTLLTNPHAARTSTDAREFALDTFLKHQVRTVNNTAFVNGIDDILRHRHRLRLRLRLRSIVTSLIILTMLCRCGCCE